MTRTNSLTLWLTVLTVFSLLVAACRPDLNNAPQPQNLGQLLTTGQNLTILRAALTRAGLDVSSLGPATLFAPTDAAFQAAGYADVNAINNVPADTLKRLLQYHILTSQLLSSSIAVGVNTALPTVAGPPVYITRTVATTATSTSATSGTGIAAGIYVNGAKIEQADNQATNGIVHTINKLLVPPTGDLVQTLGRLTVQGPNSFSLLTAALTRVGSLTTLRGTGGSYTLFAPTDAAFAKLTPAVRTVADLDSIPRATLAVLLANHVVSGRLYSSALTNGSSLTTLAGVGGITGGSLLIGTGSAGITLTSSGKTGGTPATATIIRPDVTATNGVVHVIDGLLLP